MTSSAIWQLTFGLIAILAIFAVASAARRVVAIGVVLALIPFQVVDTRYASSSELFAYTLAAVLLLTGGLRFRMLGALGLILVTYAASMSLADREHMSLQALFIFQFFSCFVVFLLAYNFAQLVEKERSVVDILLVINVLIVIYCLLQLTVGPGESFVPFGIDAFAFNQNREGDARLIGPFRNPGSTAGYFMLTILACAVELLFASGWRRLLVQLLIALSLLGLVATGNRANFLTLVAMFPVFLFVFRREMGARRVMTYILGGFVVLVLASTVAITYTDFGRMFERLGTVTETKGGVPVTRAETWPIAIEKIKLEPWFGEGPYFWTEEDAERVGQQRIEYDEFGELITVYDPYPHSLYLYLLRTVGIFGLLAVVGFFLRTWQVLYRASQRESVDKYQSAILRLGLLLVPAFLISQITLEFHRADTIDYAQFIFALMGLLVGVSDRVPQSSIVANATRLKRPDLRQTLHDHRTVSR